MCSVKGIKQRGSVALPLYIGYVYVAFQSKLDQEVSLFDLLITIIVSIFNSNSFFIPNDIILQNGSLELHSKTPQYILDACLNIPILSIKVNNQIFNLLKRI